ncbi:MAG: DUF4175 domain-containing protein [Sphingomonadales bacterium]
MRTAGDDIAVERKIRLARLALAWERAWPRLWPLVAVAGWFVCLSLFELWRPMPGWLHVMVLAGFGLAFAAFCHRAIRSYDPPRRRQAVRRIEKINNLDHRPLSALEDAPSASGGGPETQTLWRVHQERLRARLGRLRAGWPAPGLVRFDPHGLRAVLGLGLVIGFVSAGPDWPERLSRAFSPGFAHAGGVVTLEAWITPPDYTGVAPIFLTGTSPGTLQRDETADPGPVAAPAGSTFEARVHGGRRAPNLELGGSAVGFRETGGAGYEVEIALKKGALLRVAQGGETIASWPIEIVADQPPAIFFSSPPKPTARLALKVDYESTDDYGVESAKLLLDLAEPSAGPGFGRDDTENRPVAETLALELPVSSGSAGRVAATSYHDLTAHPWAGMRVTARLTARDATGQAGFSQPTTLRLPERRFEHPVARELIALRKHLVRRPAMLAYAQTQLDTIAERPSRFDHDPLVFLGLRVTYWRLAHGPDRASRAAVIALLWDLALRVEGGDMLLAERDLRGALEALAAALDSGAAPEEIERLTDQVQAALTRFLTALAKAARDQDFRQAGPADASTEAIGAETFQQMLDQLRTLNRLGSRDAARALLSSLRNILENLSLGPSPGQNELAQALNEALRNIDGLMRREQEMLDQTEDVAIGRGEGLGEDESRAREQALAGRQEAIRNQLNQMLAELGGAGMSVPGSMDRAGRAMTDAAQALKRGNPGTAMEAESEALDALLNGAGEFARALAQAAGPGGGGVGGSSVDPLGRPLADQGRASEDGVVPRQWEIRRAREILEELQRRANERRRPPIERDYIERLLKRF